MGGKRRDGNLTDKRLTFCYEYVATHFNGVQAAKRAGYAGNDHTLGSVAYNLLKDPKIKVKIAELTEKYISQVDLRAVEVIKELVILGFQDMRDFVDIDSETRKIRVRSQEEMGERSKAINKIKVKQVDAITGDDVDGKSTVVSTEIDLQLRDKVKPLEILAKHLGIIKDTTSVEFPGGEFATTKEVDLSNFTTEELRTFLKLHKKAKEKNPVLSDGANNL